MLARGGCRGSHGVGGGVLDGESLDGGITAQEGTQLGGDFREYTVVIIFDVGALLPERGAGELSRTGIEGFDIFNEARLRLDPGQDGVVQRCKK
jgi:hypothetical protein